MRGRILVVGGYGSVGRSISAALGDQFPGQVIVAGRSYPKAHGLALELDKKVIPAKLDIDDTDELDSILDSNVGLVVMCVESENTRFVKQCIKRGIHYIDISASFNLLSRFEELDTEARDAGSTILLSVGLAPGLTNLLVSHCVSKLEEIHSVDIFLLLGMGEVHGESSIQWMLDNANAEYLVYNSGVEQRVQAFGEYRRTVFPDGVGRRAAFRFNISDQHTIAKTLDLKTVSTWLCFDSAFFTWLFYLQKKLGVLKLLRFPAVKRAYFGLLKNLHIGSDMFVAQVVANGIFDGETTSYLCSVSGYGEGQTTGLIAAKVARHVYTSVTPPGVFHIDQLIDQPATFIKELSDQTERFGYQL